MPEAFICDAVRTPIGRLNGALATVRADDLAAIPLRALMERNPSLDLLQIDDVILGCANQAGEDNRNVARMAALLAGFPPTVPGVTVILANGQTHRGHDHAVGQGQVSKLEWREEATEVRHRKSP